jgi:hypothetical protein
MKSDNLLSNPALEDFENSKEQSKEEEVPVLKGQMYLDLGNTGVSPQQFIDNTKIKLRKRATVMEFSSMWRNPAIPFALTSMVLTALIIIVGGIIVFNNIPPRIPFFYNSGTNHWEQFDKAFLVFLPVGLLAIQMIILNYAIKLFHHDRKLSISISWVIVFLNILLLIAVGQIYTLIT